MHEVLVNRLGGLSLPRKSVVRLIDRPDMTLDVYRGLETTTHTHTHTPLVLIVRLELLYFEAVLFATNKATAVQNIT